MCKLTKRAIKRKGIIETDDNYWQCFYIFWCHSGKQSKTPVENSAITLWDLAANLVLDFISGKLGFNCERSTENYHENIYRNEGQWNYVRAVGMGMKSRCHVSTDNVANGEYQVVDIKHNCKKRFVFI